LPLNILFLYFPIPKIGILLSYNSELLSKLEFMALAGKGGIGWEGLYPQLFNKIDVKTENLKGVSKFMHNTNF
jgi:hypothetical protein